MNTDAWKLYETGKSYHEKIHLVYDVDIAERFYSGDQWHGVQANGLPTPVFNIHKRVIDHFISSILSQDVRLQFTPYNIPKEPENPKDQYKAYAAEIINEQCLNLWERLKMSTIMRHALRDMGLSGDAAGYSYFDENLMIADPIEVDGVEVERPKGDIAFELVDNVNVMFGNPNDYRVETQPYILIVFRSLVEDLKEEARANNIPKRDYEFIMADNDVENQAGDRAKIELDSKDGGGKATTIIKMWRDKETKRIFWNKSTKNCMIKKDVDTGLSHYLIAWTSWGFRKNSYHGIAVGTEIIPNQIFINKMFAMVMLNLMQTAFPKAVYNSSLIDKWSNQIGEAIPVEAAEDMGRVAMYLSPGVMSSQVMNVIDAAITYTKQMLGANDAALGDIRPENHSAIIALQKAAMVPLETVQRNLYQWVEDIGRIWFDIMAHKYGKRTVVHKGQKVEFDFDTLRDMQMNLRIDVGASTYWSEITSAQTLDGLFREKSIDFVQYLERMPEGYIPRKQELLDDIKRKIAERAGKPEAPIDKPSVSISYTDLPINGQIQLAQQIGIELQPQDFANMPMEQQPIQTPQMPVQGGMGI